MAVLVVGVAVIAVVAALDPPSGARGAAVEPADGARVAGAPTEVSVRFDGAIQPMGYHVTVVPAGDGATVTSGVTRVDGERLVVPVAIVGAGEYVVGYHVRLADGRQLSGQSRFTVLDSGAGPGGPLTGSGAGPTDGSTTGSGTGGHRHDDPVTLVLLAVDALLVVALVWLLVRRPRVRPGRRYR